LFCNFFAEGGAVCEAPRGQGFACDGEGYDYECAQNRDCRQVTAFNAELGTCDYAIGTNYACRNGLAAGDCCPVRTFGFQNDWCGSGLYCNDAAQGLVGDGWGNCTAASGIDGACDFCQEIDDSFSDLYSRRGYSQCLDNLACVLTRDADTLTEGCVDTISICPLLEEEVYGVDTGFCYVEPS
jgi:hypothetical protein